MASGSTGAGKSGRINAWRSKTIASRRSPRVGQGAVATNN